MDTRHHQPTRPWMEAIEMQFATLGELQAGSHDPNNIALGALRRAGTYAWTPDPIAAMVTAAMSIPETAMLSDITLPEDTGFWWFGSLIPGCRFNAILYNCERWKDERRNIIAEDVCLTFFIPISDENRHPRMAIGPITWPMQTTLAEACRALMTVRQAAERVELVDLPPPNTLFTTDDCRLLFQLFLAGCVWLQQRILTTSSGHIERHRRKQFAREHKIPPPGDVKIIELRRRESTSQPAHPDAQPVEWSCQWIVSGHWTHQVHGSKRGERRLQYILPYVKGPADKPLRVPKQTVYVVDR